LINAFFFFFFFFGFFFSRRCTISGGGLVSVTFADVGEYVVPEITSLSIKGISFERTTPGKMFTFHGARAIRFDQCIFAHSDVANTAIFIDDETYDYNAPLNVTFVDCQFKTKGPALTVSLSRPNSVVNIDIIDTSFTGGDDASASKVAIVVNKTTQARVNVRQTVRQSPVKSFVDIGSASSLLSVAGASLVLDNVDFAGVTGVAKGGAVAVRNAPSVAVNNCRFVNVETHGLKVEIGAASSQLDITGTTFKQLRKGLVVSGSEGQLTTTVSNSLFDTCTAGAINTGASGGTFRLVVIQNCASSQFGAAIATDPPANRTVIIDSCNIVANTGASDLIAIGTAPAEMSNCTLTGNGVQSQSIVHAPVGLKVTKSSFANNSALFQLYTQGDLTVEDVSFVGSQGPLQGSTTTQPTDMALLGMNRRGQFANITASQSTVASLITESPVDFVRAASHLRSIQLVQPVALNVTVPLTLSLCDTKTLPKVTVVRLAGALVGKTGDQLVVAASGALSVMRAVGCEAFVEGGAAVIDGSLTLRSYGGSFNMSRTFTGTGTLKLGVRGANVTNGDVDHAIFASKAAFGALDVTVAISRTPPVGTVITLLTFPANSNFGTLPPNFNITETTITYTVTIACAQSCNNGACVANDVCQCEAGFADSETGKCDRSLATVSGAQSTTGGGGGSTAAGSDNVATPKSALPIEIIAPAVAGGVLLLVAIAVIICCVVRKRKAKAPKADGGAMEQRGQSGAYSTMNGDKGSVTYGALPSDAERITTATGKEVVAVEWEEGSSEE
jgi:hypothetical protein